MAPTAISITNPPSATATYLPTKDSSSSPLIVALACIRSANEARPRADAPPTVSRGTCSSAFARDALRYGEPARSPEAPLASGPRSAANSAFSTTISRSSAVSRASLVLSWASEFWCGSSAALMRPTYPPPRPPPDASDARDDDEWRFSLRSGDIGAPRHLRLTHHDEPVVADVALTPSFLGVSRLDASFVDASLMRLRDPVRDAPFRHSAIRRPVPRIEMNEQIVERTYLPRAISLASEDHVCPAAHPDRPMPASADADSATCNGVTHHPLGSRPCQKGDAEELAPLTQA